MLRESALVDARIRRSSVGADSGGPRGFAVAFRLLAFFGLKRNTHECVARRRRRRAMAARLTPMVIVFVGLYLDTYPAWFVVVRHRAEFRARR